MSVEVVGHPIFDARSTGDAPPSSICSISPRFADALMMQHGVKGESPPFAPLKGARAARGSRGAFELEPWLWAVPPSTRSTWGNLSWAFQPNSHERALWIVVGALRPLRRLTRDTSKTFGLGS